MNDNSSAVINLKSLETGATDPASRPHVFNYAGSEEFLRDFCKFLKHTKAMTLKALSERSGLSISFLSMFISGHRPLSKMAAGKLQKALPLQQAESDYLNLLFVSENSDSREEVLTALRKIQNSREYKFYRSEEGAIFEYFSQPLNIVIREMVQLKNFQEDPKWIQSVLNEAVTTLDIKRALLFLEEKGFLCRDKDQKLVVAERDISCMDKIMRLSLIDYHRTMLEKAIHSLDKKDVQKDITGQTIAIDSKRFNEVVELMSLTRKRIRDMEKESLSENSADMVLHVGLVALPLAKDDKEDSE